MAGALDDETKFNAVTSFKPASLRAKRRKSPKQTKPVPGIWPVNSSNETNISQNKNFKRFDKFWKKKGIQFLVIPSTSLLKLP